MSKPILVGVLYHPPDKPDFIEHLNNYYYNNRYIYASYIITNK